MGQYGHAQLKLIRIKYKCAPLAWISEAYYL